MLFKVWETRSGFDSAVDVEAHDPESAVECWIESNVLLDYVVDAVLVSTLSSEEDFEVRFLKRRNKVVTMVGIHEIDEF